jgi:hypothetical protein
MGNWWNRLPTPRVEAAAYELVCACGTVHRGERQPGHQVVRCSGCGKGMFVLPLSPLLGGVPPPAVPEPAPTSNLRPWLWPAVAAGLTLLFVTVAFALLLNYLWSGSAAFVAVPGPDHLEPALNAGRQALLDGDFHLAVEKLDLADAIQEQHPQALSSSGRRNLVQLRRQARLLKDWPGKPLDKIFAEIAQLDDYNWQVIVHSYRGKPVVIDAELRRDASGGYRATTGAPLRLRLEGLQLLRSLPLADTRRVLFGARMTDATRDGGVVDVHFEPDSGVLLTDVAATHLGLPALPASEWKEWMRRQHEWVGD